MSADIKKYHKAFDASQIFLDNLEIDEFPIDFEELISHRSGTPIFTIPLNTYNRWKKQLHSAEYKPLVIKDAKCYYLEGKAYLIVYNEQQGSKRVRFSLFHETAHIILGHLNDSRTEIQRGGLDDFTYFFMEGEANTFTGNFLAPPILIQEKLHGKAFVISEIADTFGLSTTSVRDYRMADYKQWLSMKPTAREKSIFSRCYAKIHKVTCTVCSATFSIGGAKYCPFCGNSTLKSKGDKINMKYAGLEVNSLGKAIICPICQNEEVEENGSYCQICGTYIVNKCCHMEMYSSDWHESPCCHESEALPGNYRYCPYCGEKTTFFIGAWLEPWKKPDEPFTEVEPDEVEDSDNLPF